VNGFHTFVADRTGLILFAVCLFNTGSHFLHHCLTSMDDSNQKHPPTSPPQSPCAIESVYGDGSSDDPMCLDVVAAASRETDTNDDMENQHIPQGQFRTDGRRKHKYSASRKKLLYDFEVWLETVKKYPYIWLEDDVSLLYDSMSAYTLLMKSKGHSFC
jgi:hypothetical protein